MKNGTETKTTHVHTKKSRRTFHPPGDFSHGAMSRDENEELYTHTLVTYYMCLSATTADMRNS